MIRCISVESFVTVYFSFLILFIWVPSLLIWVLLKFYQFCLFFQRTIFSFHWSLQLFSLYTAFISALVFRISLLTLTLCWVLPHTCQNGYHQKNPQRISPGKCVERRESFYTAGGNVNLYSHYEEEYSSSLKKTNKQKQTKKKNNKKQPTM